MNVAKLKAISVAGWVTAAILTCAVVGAMIGAWTIPVIVAQGDPISPELKAKYDKLQGLMRQVLVKKRGDASSLANLEEAMELQFSHLKEALESGVMPLSEQEKLMVGLDIAIAEGERILRERKQRDEILERIRAPSSGPTKKKTMQERAAEVRKLFEQRQKNGWDSNEFLDKFMNRGVDAARRTTGSTTDDALPTDPGEKPPGKR